MAKRKENMLEAFQASATDDDAGREPEPADVGGPFAPPVRAPAESAPSRARRARVEPDLALAPVAMPFGSVTFLIIQILLLAGAFALGRLTAPPGALAGPPGSVSSEQETSLPVETESEAKQEIETPAAESATKQVEQLTDDDRAFKDPENRVTIQVIQYNIVDEWRRTLAWQAYDYLKDRGLPVVQPCTVGDSLFVYVGAARAKAELNQTLETVRKTPRGPNSKGDTFSDAYITNIPR
jgi:hypothetical protein